MWRRNLGYEIQEKLGEGSQGSVFKALRRDPQTGLSETVAIKILHSENAVELWRNEFESLRRIHSKYCVRVFAFERINGRPALVLEFVDGISLGLLAQAGALADEIADEITAQLEEAVCDLHAQDLFHGDLNPHNILIDKTGRLRLLDFGLANASGRFTPEFAAPERLSGGSATFTADLFSIGRINQFMRGQSFSPIERKLSGKVSSPEARKKLGEHVSLVHSRQSFLRNIVTRVMNHTRTSQRNSWLTAMIAAAIMCLSSSGATAKLPNEFFVQIRTNHWHYFILDGQPLGYAPVSQALQAGRSHRLEWISGQRRGVKYLSAAPQAGLILQDRDF
jgi:serine/threonine protein kinase